MKLSLSSRKDTLYLFLCGLFLTNAIIAEIIGPKIFSVEGTLGFPPAQISLLGYTLDFNMSAGVLNWPFVFVTSDIINEYFGYKGVKRISYLTAGFISYSFVLLYAATLLPPAQFWLDLNSVDPKGNPLQINEAFGMIFRQGLGIILGSLVAFLFGQIMDALVFRFLRRWTKNKFIWLRATGSTLVSQFIDSFIVIFIAFFVFGNWSFTQIIAVGSVNYLYKFAVAIAMTPLLYFAHFAIDWYLGKERSQEMIQEAMDV
ncbi:MAG: queuosine precursor transporter [Spirosomataceae bacterium]